MAASAVKEEEEEIDILDAMDQHPFANRGTKTSEYDPMFQVGGDPDDEAFADDDEEMELELHDPNTVTGGLSSSDDNDDDEKEAKYGDEDDVSNIGAPIIPNASDNPTGQWGEVIAKQVADKIKKVKKGANQFGKKIGFKKKGDAINLVNDNMSEILNMETDEVKRGSLISSSISFGNSIISKVKGKPRKHHAGNNADDDPELDNILKNSPILDGSKKKKKWNILNDMSSGMQRKLEKMQKTEKEKKEQETKKLTQDEPYVFGWQGYELDLVDVYPYFKTDNSKWWLLCLSWTACYLISVVDYMEINDRVMEDWNEWWTRERDSTGPIMMLVLGIFFSIVMCLSKVLGNTRISARNMQNPQIDHTIDLLSSDDNTYM